MINMIDKLYSKVKSIIDGWCEDGIYAISFFVESNELNTYGGFDNVTSFDVSYNTEEDCGHAGRYSEERWNYAYWRQNTTPVINPYQPNALTDLLFDWYKENGIENIGYEDDDCYDDDLNYIGKGPVGHYELLTLASQVARQLQEEGYIAAKFGKRIPIIVHGLEYAWHDIEATKNANGNGEADVFLRAMKKMGMI